MGDISKMSKRWCVTVWEEFAGLDWELPALRDELYACYGKDKAPTTGRVHWHVYVRFAVRKRGSTVTKLFPDGNHVLVAKGTEQQCRDYAWKENGNDPIGHGFIEAYPERGMFVALEGKQGARSDLEQIADDCKQGKMLAEIADTNPGDYIRYHGGIQAIHALLAPRPPLEREVTVVILWGQTATGKTHRIMHAYPEIYLVKPGRDPWGQYRGEAQILFDEFQSEKWSIQDMNRYLDKWRCALDRRYQDSFAAWTLVAICANCNPAAWWEDCRDPYLIEAFRRRIRGRCFLVPSQEPTLESILAGDSTPI